MISALEEIDINQFEYCFLCNDTYYPGTSTFKVYIPKLMPFMHSIYQEPVTQTSIFNSNIFVNDSACKPQPSKTVQFKNFINVKVLANQDFINHEYDPDGAPGYMKSGTRLICMLMDKNPRDIYLTSML